MHTLRHTARELKMDIDGHCTLLYVPSEIRLRIYQVLFEGLQFLLVAHSHLKGVGPATSILLSCRLSYAEALPVFLSVHRLEVSTTYVYRHHQHSDVLTTRPYLPVFGLQQIAIKPKHFLPLAAAIRKNAFLNLKTLTILSEDMSFRQIQTSQIIGKESSEVCKMLVKAALESDKFELFGCYGYQAIFGESGKVYVSREFEWVRDHLKLAGERSYQTLPELHIKHHFSNPDIPIIVSPSSCLHACGD